jgi:NAD(P)H-dependent flavin oxidoreductase YrpB (nitropropane dioxygenase family)
MFHTVLCDMLGIRWPIIQGAMQNAGKPRLVAAVSEAGGLGVLPTYGETEADLVRQIEETRRLTDKPFGVNITPMGPKFTESRARICIEMGVPVVTTGLGDPGPRAVAELRSAGIKVIPVVPTVRHALRVEAEGADAIVACGTEAGGHVGQIATLPLVPQVLDAVDVPVIAAGGFFDGRGLVAALAYGAEGIAMGTRFLLTEESTVPDGVKELYLARTVTDTVVTRKVDGFPHRVLRTDLVDALESAGRLRTMLRAMRNARAYRRYARTSWRDMLREGLAMRRAFDLTYGQMLMAANTPMLLRAAMVEGSTDFGVFASGQVVGVIDDLPTVAEVIERIVAEAEATLERLRS